MRRLTIRELVNVTYAAICEGLENQGQVRAFDAELAQPLRAQDRERTQEQDPRVIGLLAMTSAVGGMPT